MEDPLQYTKDEIIKNLILTETHLKQATTGVDEQFCAECLDKHFYNLEALGDEGMGFTQNKKEIDIFSEVATTAKNFRGKDYKKHGVEYARKVRNLRKSLNTCSTCTINPTKGLNNPANSNNYTYNSEGHISDPTQLNGENKEMVKIDLVSLGMYNAGQFAAEGAKYLIEENLAPQEPWVSIGGGVGLQVLPMFLKMPSWLNKLMMVAGSNLLAYGVVKAIKPASTVVAARVAPVGAVAAGGNPGKFTGRPNGRVFAGPVTATNIPTQYARSGILAGAQAFESPEHADLIRVD